MAQKTADQVQKKYQNGVGAAGGDYAAGVAAPSRPWAAATIAGQPRYEAGIQKAISEKRFAKGVQSAGDAKWSQAAQGKGARNYTAAAADAATAYGAVVGDILAAGQAARNAAIAMPDTTLEQRIARSAAAQRATSAHWAAKKR